MQRLPKFKGIIPVVAGKTDEEIDAEWKVYNEAKKNWLVECFAVEKDIPHSNRTVASMKRWLEYNGLTNTGTRLILLERIRKFEAGEKVLTVNLKTKEKVDEVYNPLVTHQMSSFFSSARMENATIFMVPHNVIRNHVFTQSGLMLVSTLDLWNLSQTCHYLREDALFLLQNFAKSKFGPLATPKSIWVLEYVFSLFKSGYGLTLKREEMALVRRKLALTEREVMNIITKRTKPYEQSEELVALVFEKYGSLEGLELHKKKRKEVKELQDQEKAFIKSQMPTRLQQVTDYARENLELPVRGKIVGDNQLILEGHMFSTLYLYYGDLNIGNKIRTFVETGHVSQQVPVKGTKKMKRVKMDEMGIIFYGVEKGVYELLHLAEKEYLALFHTYPRGDVCFNNRYFCQVFEVLLKRPHTLGKVVQSGLDLQKHVNELMVCCRHFAKFHLADDLMRTKFFFMALFVAPKNEFHFFELRVNSANSAESIANFCNVNYRETRLVNISSKAKFSLVSPVDGKPPSNLDSQEVIFALFQ